MIVQPKQQNQPNRECLYAWYPETLDENGHTTQMDPRDIYLHNGLDNDLLEQKPLTNRVTSAYSNNGTGVELVQRYKESVAPSELAYHSTETINEALTPPWALHFELKRRPATPNLPSNTTQMSTREEPPRRLKSAPVARSIPSNGVLTIPEPHFVTAIVPVSIMNPSPAPSRPMTRAVSAKPRLNTTVPNENTQVYRDIKSAHASRRNNGETKLSEPEIQEIFRRVYGDKIKPTSPVQQQQQQQPVQIIYTQTQTQTQSSPPPVYVYRKSASWCPDDVPPTPAPAHAPVRKSVEISAIPLNPHYLHRPGVIAVRNVEKKPVVRESSASKRKHHRRHQSLGKTNQPLLALTPVQNKTRIAVEIGGVRLAYDPKLSLDDKSPNLTKYFIDGRLYLIKDQRYNVLDNIDPSSLEKYNQTLTLHQRPKYYQTIPVEKFQISKPPSEPHYNASETYFYNTLPKRAHRYVIDPNFISENLNVNKISLTKRPPTATVYA